MCFIVLVTTDAYICEAYLKSSNSMNREQLDAQNLEKRLGDWIDMMIKSFNDPDVDAMTPAVPNLHSKFKERINFRKGQYNLTREKCKTVIAEHKKKLRVMIDT